MNNTKNTTKKEVSLFTRLGKGFIKVTKYTAKLMLIALNKVIKAIDYLVVFIVKKIIYLFSLVIHSSMAIWLKHNVAQLFKFLKLKLLKLYNAPYTKRLRKTALAQFVRKMVVALAIRVKRTLEAFWVALGFSVSSLKRSLVKRPQLRPVFISLVLVAMVVSLFLPIEQVRATTLQWSKNSDFGMNKAGKCNQTTMTNLALIGATNYTDQTCQAADADAQLSLAKDPNSVGSLSGITMVKAGNTHSIALKNDGTVWAWGYNDYNQLGDNTTTQRNTPVQVKDSTGTGYLTGITAISAGNSFNLALKSDGTVWAWGYNGQWQLGDNTTTNRALPVQVKDLTGTGYLTNINYIETNFNSSLALKNDGTVWGWGINPNGQLGDNTTTQRPLPTQVKDSTGTGYLSNITQISAGNAHILALKNDGTVWAWGRNSEGEIGDNTLTQRNLPVQVKNTADTGYLTDISSVSSGQLHSLALKNDGTVWAWGWGLEGGLGENATLQRNLPVQVKDVQGTGFITGITKISGGNRFSLALKNDGSVLAWGINNTGQLGDNTTTQRLLPVNVKNSTGTGDLNSATAITGGNGMSMAINSDSSISAWGTNNYGQLGDDTNINKKLPVAVKYVAGADYLGGVTSAVTSPSGSHTLALKNDGTVWGWGLNANGQLGDNTIASRSVPVQIKDSTGNAYLSGITAVAVGNNYSLALKNDGTVWGWGVNTTGQLGDNTTTQSLLPVQVRDINGAAYLTNITAISAGSSHSLALRNDGIVFGWGLNGSGQLGDSTTTQRNLPVLVKDVAGSGVLSDITNISGGTNHTLALKSDGSVYAWGSNTVGQIGDNTTTQRNLPVLVKDVAGTGTLSGIGSVSAGNVFSAVVKSDGSVYTWGANGSGQLGDNTTTQRNLPVLVKDVAGTGTLSGIGSVSAGSAHTVAKSTTGSVYAWGLNTNGQVGDNTTTQRNLPVLVKDLTGNSNLAGVTAVSTGSSYSVAVNSNGSVWGWGLNNYGQLGNGSVAQSNIPISTKDAINKSSEMSNIKQVANAVHYSVALKNDGTVWAWGYNGYGQLGDSTNTTRTTPVQVRDSAGIGYLNGVVAIAAGGQTAMALKNDGTVWAWGYNYYGNLGNGNTVDSKLPVQVKDASGTGYLTNISQITAGIPDGITYKNYGSYALSNDGTVYAWGYNGYGNLGDNTTTARNLPVQVKDSAGTGYLSGIVSIAASGGERGSHAVGVKNDGTVWAWGGNAYGQLGDGTTIQRNIPVQVKDTPGTGYLANVKSVSASGGSFANISVALKNDGTVWFWGNGTSGDGTTTQKNLPVQVKDNAGTGFLNNIKSVAAGNGYDNSQVFVLALANDGKVWGWGGNNYGQLGDNSNSRRLLPITAKDVRGTNELSDINSINAGAYFSSAITNGGKLVTWGFNNMGQLGDGTTMNRFLPDNAYSFTYAPKYFPSGSLSGAVVDVGLGKKTKWYSVNWVSQALPANTSISVSARTSNDGTTWSDWNVGSAQNAAGSTTGSSDLTSLPFSRYVELKANLNTTDLSVTPTLNDFTLSLMNDTTTPPTNASAITMKKSNSGATVNAGDWNNAPTPYFAWTAGADDGGGAGIDGYCLYLGQDANADVTTSKGLLGTSQFDTDGKCQYATHDESLDLSVAGVLGSQLSSSDQPYYLLAKAIDKAGNLYDGTSASFNFRYDNTPPNNVGFVSLPSQFIPTKDVTITWPTTGGQAVSDVNSGIAGLQYKIGNDGTWYGANHNGAQDLSDVLPNNGSYQTNATYDYPLLDEGNNLIYFRTLDNAGNVSATQTSAVLKINTASPSQPQSLNANPSTNTTNNFAFSWAEPQTFVGSKDNLTYCYTVNTLPTVGTCTYTSAGQTSIASGSYATQPGDNTFYVVARDESGNINYATAASVTFSANTSAPGIPLNADVADISVKATQNWKLALSWEKPSNEGAGIASYRIYRSTSPDSGFSQVATTSGTSYVDGSLNQSMYYYKVVACDSANNCGAESSIVSKTPTGRFTSPPELITAPSVSAGTRKASIMWTTDRTSDSRVAAGTTSDKYGAFETASSNQTKSHTVELTGLEPGTTYYYKAKWTDEDGNTGTSSELSFTTLPAPVIKNAEVIKTTLNSATVQFTSVDATKVNVLYGRTESFGGIKELNTAASESTYTVELDGLEDGSSYYYRIDPIDNDAYAYTGETHSFTTPPRPRISNLRFQPVEGEPTSTQKVSWTTNVATNSTVTYGVSGTSGSDLQDSKLTLDHSITIKGLQDDSEYFLLAQSRDGNGNLAVSDRQVFRTALDTRPPRISDVSVEPTIRGTGAEARGQVVVSWKTDEPATSQVAYAEGTDVKEYNNQTSEDTTLTTEHVVIVSDLPTSKVYSVQPLSRDKAQNQVSGDSMPAIIGRASDNVLTIVLNTMRKVLGL